MTPLDSTLAAAARELAAGDPLTALNRVALLDCAPALALRGCAMAQLGDLARARRLMQAAARAFGPSAAVARARCMVAEAEIALAARDLAWSSKALDSARAVLRREGDVLNDAHARLIEARRLLLSGQLDLAENRLTSTDLRPLPPVLLAVESLIAAGIAMRRMQASAARAALERARKMAAVASSGALMAEVENAGRLLDAPVARLSQQGAYRSVALHDIETLQASDTLLVDVCRHGVRQGEMVVALARRPVLFKLICALAEAWPDDVPREVLTERVFRIRRPDDSHRARLRVEMGRLRHAVEILAGVRATPRGYVLVPRQRSVAVLSWAESSAQVATLALLGDGEAWSSSALALALGTSQRTVQRELDGLARADRARALGRGRARRWLATQLPEFATSLLLPGPWPGD